MGKEYSKNHFVPEYYLKHFTGSDNHFYVFDKQNDRIVRKSPNQVCYEWDRNTLYKPDGSRETLLESKTYNHFDNKHAKAFDTLSNAKSIDKSTWTIELLSSLELFVPLLYWRSPLSDVEMKKKLSKVELADDFGLEIIDKNTGKKISDVDVHNKIMSDPNMQKAIRPRLAFNTIERANPVGDDLEWRVFYREKGCFLTSDNPIIFNDQPNKAEEFRTSIILPISSSRSLLRIDEGCPDSYHLPLVQDIAMVDQAIRFVICSDKSYLETVLDCYDKYKESDVYGKLPKDLFKGYVVSA